MTRVRKEDNRQAEQRWAASREGQVVVAGVRSPILEAGLQEGGEAVVFLHGVPGSSRDWEDLIPRVGQFVRAVALDMPGFGRADKLVNFDHSVDGYARHLGGVLEELGVLRAHLVLHDLGGPWGLAWATANPEKLASVTLIDTGLLSGYRWHGLARVWRAPGLGEIFQAATTRPAFRLLTNRGNPRRLSRAFVDRMYDDYDRATRRTILAVYRATEPAALSEEQAPILRRMAPPALVVWGKHDPFLPAHYAERQREVFPGAEVTVLENSGHWPFVDDPGGVIQILIPFLQFSLLGQGPNPTEKEANG